MKNRMIDSFESIFESREARVFFAPGRVNLIGEHTDYNGGHVFPCALTIGTYAAVRARSDNLIRLYSENFAESGIYEADATDIGNCRTGGWFDYPCGMMRALADEGYALPHGFDMYFYGNIPNGAGLSSSASIEVLTGYVVKSLFYPEIPVKDLAFIAKTAENVYCNVNCGIMDQFIVAMGRENSAVFLDTATLEFEYVPVELGDSVIVICQTNKKRGLNDSAYNERRAECESAVRALNRKLGIKLLCELDSAKFEANAGLIEDETVRARARHAVSENERTIRALKTLNAGNLEEFGQLMNESHKSLRDDYEVTGIELDTIVEAAWEEPGVIGARMTGAGFGGCAVAIVKENAVERFRENVGRKYKEKIGYAADFIVVKPGSGPREI